jgi:hypothetical protein
MSGVGDVLVNGLTTIAAPGNAPPMSFGLFEDSE